MKSSLSTLALLLLFTSAVLAAPIKFADGAIQATLPGGFKSKPSNSKKLVFERGKSTVEIEAMAVPGLLELSDKEFMEKANGLSGRLQGAFPGSKILNSGPRRFGKAQWHQVEMLVPSKKGTIRHFILSGRSKPGHLVLFGFSAPEGDKSINSVILQVVKSVRAAGA